MSIKLQQKALDELKFLSKAELCHGNGISTRTSQVKNKLEQAHTQCSGPASLIYLWLTLTCSPAILPLREVTRDDNIVSERDFDHTQDHRM